MISIDFDKFHLGRKVKYFSEAPSMKSGIFDSYIHSYCLVPRFGFIRTPGFTKFIYLKERKFEEDFTRTTLFHIKRAYSEGVRCSTTNDMGMYISFFKSYLERKNLTNFIPEVQLKALGDSLVMRAAYQREGQILTFHSYILDKSVKRVRLLHSFSDLHVNGLGKDEKSLIGRANKLLHYDDMLFFREQGFEVYDFGGYAFNTCDKSLQGINCFKDNFGGILVEESDYESFIILAAKILKEFSHFIHERFPGNRKL